MDRFSIILILPAVLGTLAIASSNHASRSRSLNYIRDDCSAFIHNLTVQEDGCTGDLLVVSCRGKCQSSSIPKFYMNE